MRRQEFNSLRSAGTGAERAGRMEDAKACTEALVYALREERAKRHPNVGGTRAADSEAISWGMDISKALQSSTPA